MAQRHNASPEKSKLGVFGAIATDGPPFPAVADVNAAMAPYHEYGKIGTNQDGDYGIYAIIPLFKVFSEWADQVFVEGDADVDGNVEWTIVPERLDGVAAFIKTFLTATTAVNARAAIGAGTSSVVVGTSSTNALRGDAYKVVTSLPASGDFVGQVVFVRE